MRRGYQRRMAVGPPGREDVKWTAKQSHMIFKRGWGWPGDVGASSRERKCGQQCQHPTHILWGPVIICVHISSWPALHNSVRCGGSPGAQTSFTCKHKRQKYLEMYICPSNKDRRRGVHTLGHTLARTTLRMTRTTSRAILCDLTWYHGTLAWPPFLLLTSTFPPGNTS